MPWDLKEPECLSEARLMAAPPALVYEQIKFYGENVDQFWGGKKKLEAALLGRDDRLIDLALAQFATEKEVIQTIYNRANSGAGDDEQASYKLGLRVACLSNRHFNYFNWPDFGLDALMARGFTEEARALLTNPTIRESVLLSLYKKTECFAQMAENEWLSLIYVSAENNRLNTEKDSRDHPDLELSNIQKAIFGFLETVPVTGHSIQTARHFLGHLQPEHTTWPKEISYVLKRWDDIELKDREGWSTRLPMKDELRCLIAALYARRSTDVKELPRYFGSADDPDIALRCAFYAGHDMSEKEIEAGFAKDSDVFLFAVLKNLYVLLNKKKRILLESHLYGDMAADYRRRCQQIHKERPGFDPKPISEEGQSVLDLEERPEQNSKEISWLEKISGQNEQLAARIAGFERRAYWVTLIVLVAAICWLRK